jgi:hypothetical protein
MLAHFSSLATKRQYKTKHIFQTFFSSIFITVKYEMIFRISIFFIAVGSALGEPLWGAEPRFELGPALQQACALPVAWSSI